MEETVLLCVATKAEGALLEKRLGGVGGAVGGRPAALLRTGVGPVNAALAVARFVAVQPVHAVLVCGVGGAYPGSGLEPGDVVSAETETYADLGSESAEGFLDMKALGFPVVKGHFNTLPLDLFPADRRVAFVTRSTCTGSDDAALELEDRTGGAVESMEGAAFVHAALALDLKVGEVRGISNHVGIRDRGAWRIREAAEAAQETLWRWLEAGGC